MKELPLISTLESGYADVSTPFNGGTKDSDDNILPKENDFPSKAHESGRIRESVKAPTTSLRAAGMGVLASTGKFDRELSDDDIKAVPVNIIKMSKGILTSKLSPSSYDRIVSLKPGMMELGTAGAVVAYALQAI